MCGTRVGEMLLLKVICRITNFLLTSRRLKCFGDRKSKHKGSFVPCAILCVQNCTLHALVKEKHGKRIVCCRRKVVNLQNRAEIKRPEDCLRHVPQNHYITGNASPSSNLRLSSFGFLHGKSNVDTTLFLDQIPSQTLIRYLLFAFQTVILSCNARARNLMQYERQL